MSRLDVRPQGRLVLPGMDRRRDDGRPGRALLLRPLRRDRLRGAVCNRHDRRRAGRHQQSRDMDVRADRSSRVRHVGGCRLHDDRMAVDRCHVLFVRSVYRRSDAEYPVVRAMAEGHIVEAAPVHASDRSRLRELSTYKLSSAPV